MYTKMKRKKMFRKTVSFLLTLCMMISLMLPLMSVTAVAAAPTTYTDISTNSTASVSITSSWGARYFRFIPTATGTYKFYSSANSGDPKASLLDASGTTLATNDDYSGLNFLITYDCTAGTTYYISAHMWSSGTGSYTLNVETVSIDCDCNFIYQSSTSADCENDGVDIYVCSLCGNTDRRVTTPAYGHDYVNGVCTRCGDVDYDTITCLDITRTNVYQLFNSGSTSSRGNAYSTSGNGLNINDRSYTNGGYDIYGDSPSYDLTRGLGLSFYVSSEVTEDATLTIYAYDIDEEYSQIDDIYLVNDSTGERIFVGNLQGRDSTWSTTTLSVDKELFVIGQTYHFEVDICLGGWWTWVRRVSLDVVCGRYVPIEISDYSFNASIDNNGNVNTNLSLTTNQDALFYLEYTATINNEQKGGCEGYTITATENSSSLSVDFLLESGSPKGVYEIRVILKDSAGNTKGEYACSAGYDFIAVTYDANGGSQNLPGDGTGYSDGDVVVVKFDSIPSLYGYTFLGWSTDRNATEPMYTENGVNTFTIGTSDVTLYAVWELTNCAHDWTEISRTEPTCTSHGLVIKQCSVCDETVNEPIAPLQHDYQIVYVLDATCTVDGYIEYACQNDGCTATKRQTIDKLGHYYDNNNICINCGEAAPHTHSYTENVVAPTCSEMGYTEYICSCGYSYRNNFVEPNKHQWDGGVVTLEATCTTNGVMTYTCVSCSITKTTVIVAEHDWALGRRINKTCTTDGSITMMCNVCYATEIEIIPASHNWDAGVETLAPWCETDGAKTCTCLDCGEVEEFVISKLGHEYYNGICSRCGESFIDNVTTSSHPIYGMYFEIDDILSDYGPSLIDEYGLMLDYNTDANLEKVGVYLTQDGTMWRRCIAVKGTNIQYATYVPYLAYEYDIKYTGLNHDWINTFRLSENARGVWCYSNYATIGVNLQDAYGNLLLSLYDIGQAGAETRLFDDLDEMIEWLEGHECTPGDWIVDENATCVDPGSKHKECTVCGEVLETETIDPTGYHTESDWIIDAVATTTQAGSKHKECTVCHTVLETEIIPIIAKLAIDNVVAQAGDTVSVAINIHNNPGILGAVLTIEYDPALTLISADAGSAWRTLSFTRPHSYTTPCNFVWDGVSGADSSDGSVVILTFEIPEDAEIGTVYNVTASYTSGNIVNENLEPVQLEIENGAVTVINPLGDVNDDGTVDIADVIVLRRYLADAGNGVVIDADAADMNRDGNINVMDVVLLRRYLISYT